MQASNPVLVLKPDSKDNVGTDIPLSSHSIITYPNCEDGYNCIKII